MSNKRKNTRRSCLVPVDGKDGSIFSQLQTVDFCKEGMGFISQRKIPLNKRIAIEINLSPDEEPVLVKGKVKWVRLIKNSDRYRVGIHFEDVLRGSKSRLQSYFQQIRKERA